MSLGWSKSFVQQRGVVLLVLLLAMLGLSALLLVQTAYTYERTAAREVRSGSALAAAKMALVAFALNYTDNYGHNTRGGVGRLPCPAVAKYSSPNLSCAANEVGYLPALWSRDGKLMDIDYLERFVDRDLWYAVAADFRYNPSFNALNPQWSYSPLQVDSTDDIVAVIIDPGPALPHQRQLRGTFDVGAYLEGENADGDGAFSVSQAHSNDRLVWISRAELMPLIERRVLGVVRDWLRQYKTAYGHYPYASALGSSSADCKKGQLEGFLSLQSGDCSTLSFGDFKPAGVNFNRRINQTWFAKNQWARFIYYQVDEHCAAALVGAELCDGTSDPSHLLTVDGQTAELLLVSVGRELHSEVKDAPQRRDLDPASKSEYLDTVGLLAEPDGLQTTRVNQLSNDQVLLVKQEQY